MKYTINKKSKSPLYVTENEQMKLTIIARMMKKAVLDLEVVVMPLATKILQKPKQKVLKKLTLLRTTPTFGKVFLENRLRIHKKIEKMLLLIYHQQLHTEKI